MNKTRKILIIILIILISSQIHIEILLTNFRISFAVIIFPTLIYIFKDLRTYNAGLFVGTLLYIQRLILHLIEHKHFFDKITVYLPEVVFYTLYGFILVYIIRKRKNIQLHILLFYMILLDFLLNLLEVLLSSKFIVDFNINKITFILLIVAIIRSLITIGIILIIKYYKMFLIKTEHEKRYKKLVWLFSKLRSEMYWMEKNMIYIEKIMDQSYKLFEDIRNIKDEESWSSRALEISKDIHEIKKEYALTLIGLEEVLEGNINEKGLKFKEILSILEDSLDKLINSKNKNIKLNFDIYENFYTTKHYQLISILRNILVNSIEAIDKKEGKITLIHMQNDTSHTFVIKDNGKGIKREDISNVFNPGFTTKINSNTGYLGRGIGLNLVKDLVENTFNGKIKLYSLIGEETIFNISIPKENL
ncbi:ATP-binding protein [Clostridium sp. D2Q-14]|uniref:ATP-binding protein n=1 Tax=Anaeromonas gelatinilytica TaxID=2683194 RepID=UPI00193B27DA|nr:ATP-binding protein [Anaeromonas gelatinilytica]MBS4534909.1 ATP-binding protein [Anaeromonas gelatinilytica]